MTLDNKTQYMTPPDKISELIDVPLIPAISVDPKREFLLLLHRPNMPSITEISGPELRLGGIRINPLNNGSSRTGHFCRLELISLFDDRKIEITNLPENPKIKNVSWSPDGNKIAFTLTRKNGIELWYALLSDGIAKRLTKTIVNNAMSSSPYKWLHGSKSILFFALKDKRGLPPEREEIPVGPVIRESHGKAAPVITYQDVLKNADDERLFDYYLTSQFRIVTLSGRSRKIGNPDVYRSFRPSPDGKYILVLKLEKPYSYLVPYERFPVSIEIWDKNGNFVKNIAKIPLAEDIPKGFGAVRSGPRSLSWRGDKGAELYYVEALDGGDPNNEAEFRDRLFSIKAPFTGEPEKILDMELRFSGLIWGTGKMAVINECWWKNRMMKTSIFQPDHPEIPKKVIFDRSTEDIYNDPGDFEIIRNKYGYDVLLTDSKRKFLYLSGEGASPTGDVPFSSRYELKSGKVEKLFESSGNQLETPIIMTSPVNILTKKESKSEPQNFFIRNIEDNTLRQLTYFPNPYPQLKNVHSELIKYKRKDGVNLTGKLYLPPDYKKENGPLPLLIWAYPREYKNSDSASQVIGSNYRFIRISWASPLFALAMGYAVLDNPTMPIIGEGDKEPNDTYIEQLVDSAAAAIDYLAEKGIADRKKIAVGGHSYGAFMTANLLAHSDLFAAGIARSGAYNRTMTPFGFQSEERTLWEAKEVYNTMSPFIHADKIKTPLLLIHGASDNNPGTYPFQSERLFTALKGLGATSRLVMLPHESHGYRARESLMHMLYEMHDWLREHVK